MFIIIIKGAKSQRTFVGLNNSVNQCLIELFVSVMLAITTHSKNLSVIMLLFSSNTSNTRIFFDNIMKVPWLAYLYLDDL